MTENTNDGWQDVGGVPPRILAARCIERAAQGVAPDRWIARHVHPALQDWVRAYLADPRRGVAS